MIWDGFEKGDIVGVGSYLRSRKRRDMSWQINDRVFHRKIEFQVLDEIGEGLFHPHMHGYEPLASCTNCVRGYHVRYAIENEQLVLSQVTIGSLYRYDGKQELVRFTGVLFLAADRIEHPHLEFYCPPASRYRNVRQVRFDEGRLIEDEDRSQEVAEIRRQHSYDPEELHKALMKASTEYLKRKNRRKRDGEPGDELGGA